MKVIFGLGNPGLRFSFSRHNLGFLVVEQLAQGAQVRMRRRSFNCLWGEGSIENQAVLLAKPLTFMNLSGQAVAAVVKRKKIKIADLLVICDDLNLPLGKIRLRAKGSDGGHKGLRSIIQTLDSKDFPRLRIGVDSPPRRGENRGFTRHVLGRFTKSQTKTIDEAIGEAASAACVWVKTGIASAMNKYNAGA